MLSPSGPMRAAAPKTPAPSLGDSPLSPAEAAAGQGALEAMAKTDYDDKERAEKMVNGMLVAFLWLMKIVNLVTGGSLGVRFQGCSLLVSEVRRTTP